MAAPPDDFLLPADPGQPAPLTDDEIAQLLAGPAPRPQQQPPAASWAERFEVLNRRRGRALSDEQIAAILSAAPAVDRPAELPTANVSPVPYRPAGVLGYRTRHARRPTESADAIRELPLPLRVARVVVWLIVAALMLLVFFAGPSRN